MLWLSDGPMWHKFLIILLTINYQKIEIIDFVITQIYFEEYGKYFSL